MTFGSFFAKVGMFFGFCILAVASLRLLRTLTWHGLSVVGKTKHFSASLQTKVACLPRRSLRGSQSAVGSFASANCEVCF